MVSRYDAHLRHAEHYVAILQTADELYQEGGDALKRGLLLLRRESPNIHTGREWAETQALGNDRAAFLCSDYQKVGAFVFDLNEHPRDRLLWLEVALACSRRLKDPVAEAAHLNALGMVNDELGETRLAISLYEQRITIARKIGDLHGEAKSLGNMGVAYKNSGNVDRAIECFEAQLNISRSIHDLRGEANALGGLGIAHARLGHLNRAVDYHQQSLHIDRQIGDRRGEGNATGNLAGAYFLLGDMSRALVLYHQRLDIARELADRQGEGNALWGLSLVSDKRDDRGQALQYAKAALKIFEEIESPSAGEMRAQLTEWS
jgi:tetratricopeptide (TPR) repeat protein